MKTRYYVLKYKLRRNKIWNNDYEKVFTKLDLLLSYVKKLYDIYSRDLDLIMCNIAIIDKN